MDIRYEIFSPVYSDRVFDLILSIQRQEFGIEITREDQPDLARIPEFYQTGKGNFWIALADDAVVGTISLRDIGNHQAALRKMFVRADHRGKDVAQNLLRQALRWAGAHRISDIYLGTTAKFLAAHRFYEKNGFVEIAKADLPPSFPVMVVDSKFYRYQVG